MLQEVKNSAPCPQELCLVRFAGGKVCGALEGKDLKDELLGVDLGRQLLLCACSLHCAEQCVTPTSAMFSH